MKRRALLHAELSHAIACMGHGDMLVIGDAGLPIPPGPRRIDLAVTAGIPAVDEVLCAVLSELQVERAIVATEAVERAEGQLPDWCLLPVAPETVPHEEFKRLCQQARVMVRTGECTPYANVILIAGVTF
ncbi:MULTISPECIES: D-ribose pyranase [unclassified Acidovorax]|uniref:D-ribose pyranase n=1 Tax=unclassified Acidovorax TaxID=2684926 RepID=UPI0023DE1E36|nr:MULTISPECIES: D-ribose pyranase [Comamonadaceae]WOI44287.1 D-ribose pyranase [Paracidovorax avenae]GKS92038.1 D-ribose pyranase [Acidovorax sp. SUPP2539]GKS98604.1 D-ribose pyranase [Acidovorax sp. SUPP3434]